MSLVAHTVQVYFQTLHSSLNQPDLITFHIEFLARTASGPASLSITPIKLGRQFSTVRVQLLQQDKTYSEPRLCLEALVTQGNLAIEAQNQGMSLHTRPLLDKFSFPKKEVCKQWVAPGEWLASRPAACKVTIFFPSGSEPLGASPTYGPSVKEEWVHWAPGVGKVFDVTSLPYLADCFGPLAEAYGVTGNWYPTLSYGMEVKRGPGEGKEGWECLFLRVEMHEVRNGRFDLEVWILDGDGQVVAISRHTALVVGSERNYKERGPEGAKI
jgi:hypothetical protein